MDVVVVVDVDLDLDLLDLDLDLDLDQVARRGPVHTDPPPARLLPLIVSAPRVTRVLPSVR